MSPIYRMPVGFGPSLGPRQGPDGKKFNGDESRCTSVAVTFRTDRDRMAAILPDGFEPAEDPRVRVQTNFNTDFGWLAGRGYNFAEVVLSAVYHGEEETVAGDFVAVMWESMADPIISGREELGLPKLFADIPDLRQEDGATRMTASWEGFEFLDLKLDGLDLPPWPSDLEAGAEVVNLSLGGADSPVPRLYYKYLPRTANLEEADAAYVTMTPPGNYGMKVLETWNGEGSVNFNRARWEDLPTFAQVVNGLAELEIKEYVGASMSRVIIQFDDLTGVQRVLK